ADAGDARAEGELTEAATSVVAHGELLAQRVESHGRVAVFARRARILADDVPLGLVVERALEVARAGPAVDELPAAGHLRVAPERSVGARVPGDVEAARGTPAEARYAADLLDPRRHAVR